MPTSDGLARPVRVEAATLARVAAVTVQLVALALVLQAFQLETRSLYHLVLLAAAAYPIHALLPAAWRIPGFAVVSLLGLFVVLEPGHVARILAIGAGLVAACHLPIAWRWRVLLLVAAGVGLGLGRAGILPLGMPGGLWPIVGAIFMFRLALYAHAVRHGDAPTGFWPTAAYFLMLPNVAFPLFPVVDYKAFTRGSGDAPIWRVHELGVRWMLRGIAHLLLYRLIYYHLTIDPADVFTLGNLAQAVVSAYLLYLRVSGQFHLIVGLLHLFGFHLPETHHLYYLAAGFTDLWRRINLYWTDFMMKLVYYPSFFRLRRHGQLRALLLSTAAVFVVTWALHAWQTFWLVGKPGFTVPDALFWGILAALVLVTTVYERKRPRRAVEARWSLRRAAAVTGTFLGMCLLWSLWSSESVAEWWSMFSAAGTTTPTEVAVLLALLGGFVAIAGWPWGARRPAAPAGELPLLHQLRAGVGRVALAGGLLVVAQPRVEVSLPESARTLARSLRQHRLNARDEAMLQRGYYEQLNATNRIGGQVWDVLSRRPSWWTPELPSFSAWRPRDDLLLGELLPHQAFLYKGQPFTTNAWGMRDDPVLLAKPAGTLRVAVLGPSLVMGYGVADADVFDRHLEAMFRQGTPGRAVEVLNFGFEGHSLTQQLLVLEDKVRPFAPDVVVITVSPIEHRLAAEHLRHVLRRGLPIRYDSVAALVARAGLGPTSTHDEAVRAMRPHDATLQRWALTTLRERIEEMGAEPMVMAMRMPTQHHGRLQFSAELARELGWQVLDLTDAYGDADEDSLRVAPWDRHPNPQAHRLVAEVLHQLLTPVVQRSLAQEAP